MQSHFKHIIQYSVYTRDMIRYCQMIIEKWSLTVDLKKNKLLPVHRN